MNEIIAMLKISWFLLATLVVVVILGFGCQREIEETHKCARDLRRERVVQIVSSTSDESNVVHSNQTAKRDGLNGVFTTIERRSFVAEYGSYDSLWIGEKHCFYSYVEYRCQVISEVLDFVVAWPMKEKDTLPCVFFLIQRHVSGRHDTTTTVTTNLKSLQRIKQIAGHSVDEINYRQWDVEISYKLLGIEPLNFFVQIRVGGQPLSEFSPGSNICFRPSVNSLNAGRDNNRTM